MCAPILFVFRFVWVCPSTHSAGASVWHRALTNLSYYCCVNKMFLAHAGFVKSSFGRSRPLARRLSTHQMAVLSFGPHCATYRSERNFDSWMSELWQTHSGARHSHRAKHSQNGMLHCSGNMKENFTFVRSLQRRLWRTLAHPKINSSNKGTRAPTINVYLRGSREPATINILIDCDVFNNEVCSSCGPPIRFFSLLCCVFFFASYFDLL